MTPQHDRRSGLTLVELLLAITLLSIISAVTYLSFDAAVRAWRVGTEAANSLHHSDYVLEQLVMGLRSAYYPDATRPAGIYGFTLNDDGEGADGHDTISWVKLGSALVGADAPFAGSPHRVEVSVQPAGDDEAGGFAVRAWRIDAQPEEFDPAEDVETLALTDRIIGLNCRVLDPEKNLAEGDAPDGEEKLEWLDEWTGDYTNRLPYAVEINLYLKPTDPDAEPLEVRRIVQLPLAPLSWRDKGAAGGNVPSSGSNGQGAGGRRAGQPSADARGSATGTRGSSALDEIRRRRESIRNGTRPPGGGAPLQDRSP